MFHQKIIQVQENRLRSTPLPGGSAPYTCSDHFKLPSTACKPQAKSWDHLFSLEGAGMSASTLKAAVRVVNPVISLGIARPSPEYFPWSSLTMEAPETCSANEDVFPGDHVSMVCNRGEDAFDLDVASNYGYAAGSPQLLRFVTEHVEMIHNPPYQDWDCALSSGSTSALDIALRIFCDRGDWVLAEAHTYSGTVDRVKAQGLNMVGIEMDSLGLIPEDLDSKLRSWDRSRGKKPSVMYIIPTGQNPTGFTQSIERRKAVYQVAEQHDLYILEDDPYFYLQIADTPATPTVERTTTELAESYVSQLPASYVSLDRSGRVLRMDTASKIIAPGLRCGWITGCSQVVDKFLAYTELSTISPSGFSQMMLYKLLDEEWGHEGFIVWLSKLSSQYRQRLDVLDEACHQHLPAKLCQWFKPTEGMFLWIKVDWTKHPRAPSTRNLNQVRTFCLDLEDRIFVRARTNGVLVSKGSWFSADDAHNSSVHFRLTFAAALINTLNDAVEKLGSAVRVEFLPVLTTGFKNTMVTSNVTEILVPDPQLRSRMDALQG